MTVVNASGLELRPPGRAQSVRPLPRPALAFTPELAREMEPLYARVKHVVTPMEWVHYAPLVKAINGLKKERNAVILAHNYMTPEIFHCVGDFRGDSLQLAKEAARTTAEVIVQAGVHFMAETSKLLNPDKTVLIPDLEAGCSLAASITAEDVRMLRAAYPGVPIVTYVNTSAAVKAECDICCTSSNAVKVVESLARRAPHPRRVPGQVRADADEGRDPRLEGALRGARALHRRGARRLPCGRSRRQDHRPSRVPARGDRGVRLHRLDGGDDRLGQDAAPQEGRARDGMLDVLQRRRRGARCRVRAALQPVPAHEADQPGKILDSLLTMQHEVTVDPIVAERARRAVERMVNLTN